MMLIHSQVISYNYVTYLNCVHNFAYQLVAIPSKMHGTHS